MQPKGSRLVASLNSFTSDNHSAFSHIEVIPDLQAKGFLFDATAPYNYLDERMTAK